MIPYEPLNQTVERVYVNGTRIPIINDGLTLYERKEGPMDITRYADVRFPAHAFDVDWTEYVSALDSTEQSAWHPVDIDLYNGEEYVTAFRGFVGELGDGDTPNEAQMGVWDVGKFLNSIPASRTNIHSNTLDYYLEWVCDELSDAQPVFNNISYTIKEPFQIGLRSEDFGIDNPYGDGKTVTVQAAKSFRPNRHTMLDVVNWLRDIGAIRMWFAPDGDTVQLVVAPTPPQRTIENDDVDIIDNNLLHQISPSVNAVRAKGEASKSIGNWRTDLFNGVNSQPEYAEVVVEHPRLVERVGRRGTGKTREVSGMSKAEVIRQAKSILKNALDEQGSGEAVLSITPFLRPYDLAYLKPEWDRTVDKDVPPLRYEIEEVEHQITATEGERTVIHCSTETKMSDIEVVSAEMKGGD